MMKISQVIFLQRGRQKRMVQPSWLCSRPKHPVALFSLYTYNPNITTQWNILRPEIQFKFANLVAHRCHHYHILRPASRLYGNQINWGSAFTEFTLFQTRMCTHYTWNSHKGLMHLRKTCLTSCLFKKLFHIGKKKKDIQWIRQRHKQFRLFCVLY